MTKNTFETNTPEADAVEQDFDIVPIVKRTSFELFLMRKDLGDKLTHKPGGEWKEAEEKWVEDNAIIFGNIIDDVNNKELRTYVMEDRNEEALEAYKKILETSGGDFKRAA